MLLLAAELRPGVGDRPHQLSVQFDFGHLNLDLIKFRYRIGKICLTWGLRILIIYRILSTPETSEIDLCEAERDTLTY